MVSIDFSQATTKQRTVKGKRRSATYVRAYCACGYAWDVRKDKAPSVTACYQCAQREKARRGYAATAAKYGRTFAAGFAREYRLEHPSDIERIVASWLDALGVPYEREYTLTDGERLYFIDFMACGVAVEVNGAYWHAQPAAVERDERKAAALAYAGVPLLVLSECDVWSGDGYHKLRAALFGVE